MITVLEVTWFIWSKNQRNNDFGLIGTFALSQERTGKFQIILPRESSAGPSDWGEVGFEVLICISLRAKHTEHLLNIL